MLTKQKYVFSYFSLIFSYLLIKKLQMSDETETEYGRNF